MKDMIDIDKIVSEVRCDLLNMRVVLHEHPSFDYWYVQVHGRSRNFCKPGDLAEYDWTGRKWLISRHMTETEVVNTCLLAFRTALEHEMHEAFRYQGKQVKDPHVAVWHMMDGCGQSVPQDVRGDSINGA